MCVTCVNLRSIGFQSSSFLLPPAFYGRVRSFIDTALYTRILPLYRRSRKDTAHSCGRIENIFVVRIEVVHLRFFLLYGGHNNNSENTRVPGYEVPGRERRQNRNALRQVSQGLGVHIQKNVSLRSDLYNMIYLSLPLRIFIIRSRSTAKRIRPRIPGTIIIIMSRSKKKPGTRRCYPRARLTGNAFPFDDDTYVIMCHNFSILFKFAFCDTVCKTISS